MPPPLVFRGSRDDLRRLISGLPAVLAGKAPDPLQVGRGFQLRLSTALLSQVMQDAVTLSRGGFSRDMRKWAPLAPSTVAKRLRKERRAKRGRKGKKSPYAGKLEIGRDTGRMFRSLTPGVEGAAPTNPDTVAKPGRGELVVGTNLPYAAWFHAGVPKRQPPRPLWPPTGRIPGVWLDGINAAALRGVVRAVELAVRAADRGA